MKPTFLFFLFFFALNIQCQTNDLDKSLLPQPIFEEQPALVDLYWKTWELAHEHIKQQDNIPQSPYMDEAFADDKIWIWDTEFMVLFCKYAPKVFPGIESLNNFYEPILNKKTSDLIIQHPDNPPFFAWAESDYYNFTNDTAHIRKLLKEERFLQRHYHWFNSLKQGTKLHFKHARIKAEQTNLGYKWGNVQSGMDNTPRGGDLQKEMLWVDAIAQQALSALYISRLAASVGEKQVANRFKKRYNAHKKLINQYYWDSKDGFYYDILETDTSLLKVRTPASYWVMLAEIPTQAQAKKMLKYAENPKEFGGNYPWTTVSRSDKDFNAEYGDYWRGSIWIPTAYMATKALEKYGFYEVADENAYQILLRMLETYQNYEPATIWECYNPSKPEPAQRIRKDSLQRARPDFCGWSALAPISMFIENVLGFHHVNAQTKTVEWRKYRTGKHGIKNLQFGDIKTDIVANNNKVKVVSNAAYTLKINDKVYAIKKGKQTINLE